LGGIFLREQPSPVAAFDLIMKRRQLAGSSIRETQEMLDFCADHGIVCDIEKIQIQQINEAYKRLLKSDVKYRFVIGIKSLG
jgi:alcohol dehydrogenase (NADP+)